MTIQAVSKEGVTAKIDWVSGKVVPSLTYSRRYARRESDGPAGHAEPIR
jgi:hypothetical protein